MLKENENFTEQKDLGASYLSQSGQFINKLSKISSLNSNDLDLSNSGPIRIKSFKNRVLLEEFRNCSKKDLLDEDSGSSPDRKNSAVKRQVD